MATDILSVDFSNPAPNDDLDKVQWIHGSVSPKHNTDPDLQVYWYNSHTAILRQNKAVHYEAPFLFLLFGNAGALLLDTGSTASPAFCPIRETVDNLMTEWLRRQGDQTHLDLSSYPLTVAHTHLHRDHYEGDKQFIDRPNTTIVEKTLQGTQSFYGFQSWPNDIVVFDKALGPSRPLHVIATPGHEEAEVTIYDAYSQLLFTGDLVLPGRLYVRDWSQFVSSIHRLVKFCCGQNVKYLVGCHIEMSRYPKVDYLIRTTYQPYERPLPLSVDHLLQVQAACEEIKGEPGHYKYDAFHIVYPVPEEGYFAYENMDDEALPGDPCRTCALDRQKGKFLPR